MPQVFFRFYGNLNDFLVPARKHVEFSYDVQSYSTIKDAIESLGVPHPEIDLILVNHESVSFSFFLKEADFVSIYPCFTSINVVPISKVRPPDLSPKRFVLDVHLGKLASYLRILGFDALYRNHCDDEDLAHISSQEQQLLLTQDRGLLKRSIVTYGLRFARISRNNN